MTDKIRVTEETVVDLDEYSDPRQLLVSDVEALDDEISRMDGVTHRESTVEEVTE